MSERGIVPGAEGPIFERAVLDVAEVREVLSRYALVKPITMQPLGRGSRSIAKSRLITPRGQFLLKRRAQHRSDPDNVAFVHGFHRHLEARAVQVAPLVLDRSGQSAVTVNGHVYELFGWVDGERWKRTVGEAGDAGLGFGRLLRKARGCTPPGRPLTLSYHAHPAREVALNGVVASACTADPDTDASALASVCRTLDERAIAAAQRAAGVRATPQGVVHGDLHPGNVLFQHGRLAAIVDFDSARMDWRAAELASAALHFGNDPISGVPIDEWDAGLDLERVGAILQGAERGLGEALLPVERTALPWLMIEACIVESAVPIARRGRFGDLRADRLLAFVDRKTAWIEAHAAQVSAAGGL